MLYDRTLDYLILIFLLSFSYARLEFNIFFKYFKHLSFEVNVLSKDHSSQISSKRLKIYSLDNFSLNNTKLLFKEKSNGSYNL